MEASARADNCPLWRHEDRRRQYQ